MKAISNHIKAELKKTKSDSGLLHQLNKILEKGSVSFEEFANTGRFMSEKDFRRYNPRETLLHDCTDVVVYAGNLYIQVTKSGLFTIVQAGAKGKLQATQLEVAEKALWQMVAEKLLNNEQDLLKQ
jgi:hypothetical protein